MGEGSLVGEAKGGLPGAAAPARSAGGSRCTGWSRNGVGEAGAGGAACRAG